MSTVADNGVAESSDHVVVLVHGIRDRAFWQIQLRPILVANGFIVEPTNYERFDLVRFLAPVPFFRTSVIANIWLQIEQIVKRHPDAKISIIAHSFGTYIVSKILQRRFNFTAHRVIFCGSVVRYNFAFQGFLNRFQDPILNDVGSRDFWPCLAESVTWGYGSSGTFGFKRPYVEDRWHFGFKHGDFLTTEFARDYWIPFLKLGKEGITPGSTQEDPPPWWIRLVAIAKIKYFVTFILAIAVFIGVSRHIFGYHQQWDSGQNARFTYLNRLLSADFLKNDLGAICPYKWVPFLDCTNGQLIEVLTGRHYASLTIRGDDESGIPVVVCERLTVEERNPLNLLKKISEKFHECINLKRSFGAADYELEVSTALPVSANATGARAYGMCKCSIEQIEKFKTEEGN